jgi:hypothetical protein
MPANCYAFEREKGREREETEENGGERTSKTMNASSR